MWYQNIWSALFGFVTKCAYDRQMNGRTDRITTPKNALAKLRRLVKGNTTESVHFSLS